MRMQRIIMGETKFWEFFEWLALIIIL